MQLCTTKYVHTWSEVLYLERERESELSLGQCYNSESETCLCCRYGNSGEKPFLFLTVRYIYQSQLTVVCFDLASQIPAGEVRRTDNRAVRGTKRQR